MGIKLFENQDNQVLTNEPNFKEFLGTISKVESISNGSMMLLNFASSNSKLTIHYTSDNTNIGDNEQVHPMKLKQTSMSM